jgi:hypothetical protein
MIHDTKMAAKGRKKKTEWGTARFRRSERDFSAFGNIMWEMRTWRRWKKKGGTRDNCANGRSTAVVTARSRSRWL